MNLRKIVYILLVTTILSVVTGCRGHHKSTISNSDTNETNIVSDNNKSNESYQTISGYVIDEPVVGATIEVYDKNGKYITKEYNSSDVNGNFNIELNSTVDYPILIKASDGKIKNQPFRDTMYSICFESQCNITPVTTIIALSFINNISIVTQSKLDKFARDELGIDDWTNKDNSYIASIRQYINEHNTSLDTFSSDIVDDIRDGFLDNNDYKSIFPSAKFRETVNKQYEIGLSDIEDIKYRNLKLLNLMTGEKVDINESIPSKEYGLNVALVEEYKYTIFDGTEQTHTDIIYMPFLAYSENKLNVDSSIYALIFMDPILSSLNNTSKKDLIQIFSSKYPKQLANLREDYKKYINIGDEYKSKLNSDITIAQNTLKEYLNSFNGTYNTQSKNRNLQKLISRSINFNNKSKNEIALGGLYLHYNPTENKFYFNNILPTYYGMTSQDDYTKFWNSYGDEIFSIKGIRDSFKHNLINESSGGAAGIIVSSIFSKLTSNHSGGEPTEMNCEEFDGSMCEKSKISRNYQNTYVVYKDLRMNALPNILNYMDFISKTIMLPSLNFKKVKKIIETTQDTKGKFEKNLKLVIDYYETLSEVVDIVLDITDMFAKEGVGIITQDNLNNIKNIKGNIDSLESEIEKFTLMINIDLEELKNRHSELSTIKQSDSFIEKLSILSGVKNLQKFKKKLDILPLPPLDHFEEIEKVIKKAFILSLLFDRNKYFEYYKKYSKPIIIKSDSLFVHLYLAIASKAVKKLSTEKRQEWINSISHLISMNGKFAPSDTLDFIIQPALKISSYSFKKEPLKFLKDSFKNINGKVNTIKIAKNLTNKLNNLNYANIKNMGEFLIDYILVPLYYNGISSISGAIKDKLEKAIFATFSSGGTAFIVNAANELAGKAVSFIAFPNKITFRIKTAENSNDVYFAPGISGITPVAFEKGIVYPWQNNQDYMSKAFLKRPTNDSYYGVIVTSKDNPAWYRPYFQTIFKEPAVKVRGELDGFDYKIFAKVVWKYMQCSTDAIQDKYTVDESKCKNFNNNKLIYTITGDDIDGGNGGDTVAGYHDKFILPFPDKKGNENINGSYFDFFDYLAVKFSNGRIDVPWGPGLKDSNIAIYNKTRGIYLDKIVARYYAIDDKDSKFTSPEATNTLFKIANSSDIDINIIKGDNSLKIVNNSNFPISISIIKTTDYGANNLPTNYSSVIPANGSKDIPYSNISYLGNRLTIIAVDNILQEYSKYIGIDNILGTIYSLKPKDYTYQKFFENYANNRIIYSFMKVIDIETKPNNPPVIDDASIMINDNHATLKVSVHDVDNDKLVCQVNWGDNIVSIDKFDCSSPITHIYKNTEVYTVNITVSDERGATAKTLVFATIDKVVNIKPIAKLSASKTTMTKGETITLDASDSNDSDGEIVHYIWSDSKNEVISECNDKPICKVSPDITTTYTLKVVDDGGLEDSTDITITVKESDTIPPTIILKGDNPIILTIGDIFEDPGAIVKDNVDKERIIYGKGKVDTSKEGTYKLTYDATDEAGNKAKTVTRTINVEKPEPTYKLSLISETPKNGITINPSDDNKIVKSWKIQNISNHPVHLILEQDKSNECNLKAINSDDITENDIKESKVKEFVISYEEPKDDGDYQCYYKLKDNEGNYYKIDGDDLISIKFKFKSNPLLVNTDFLSEIEVGDDAIMSVQINNGNPPFTYNINWGDYDSINMSNDKQYSTFSHTYTNVGTYNVKVNIKDKTDKNYYQEYKIKVTKEPSLITAWKGFVDIIKDNNGSNTGDIKQDIIVEKETYNNQKVYTYSINYTKQSDDKLYYTKYKLPIPPKLIKLDKQARVVYITQIDTSTDFWNYDRQFLVRTNIKKYGVNIQDTHNNTNQFGIFIKEDLVSGTKTDINTSSFVDYVVDNDGLSSYAIKLDESDIKVEKVSNGNFTTIYDYQDTTGEYLSQLQIDFKGDGKLVLVYFQYDQNGDGNFDKDETLILNTADKEVDWSQFSDTKNIRISGVVTDVDKNPLSDINVKFSYLLNGEEKSFVTTTNAWGEYTLRFKKDILNPNATYLIYAYKFGYMPDTKTLQLDGEKNHYDNINFTIRPVKENEILLEIEPKIHHLGDDNYTGTANSQFQKKTEGTVFAKQFTITTEQYDNYNNAVLKFEAKGIQNYDSKVSINGIGITLESSPEDGSYKTYTIPLDKDIYHEGINSIKFTSSSTMINYRLDYDDYEFSNVRIEFQ